MRTDRQLIASCSTYEAAFEVAANAAGTRHKEAWRGRVRIKYRRASDTFDVQVLTTTGVM